MHDMFVERVETQIANEDSRVREMKENSGKEELDVEIVSDFLLKKARNEKEREVLGRITSNPELRLSIQKDYYLHTSDEVKTTEDYIEWIKNWEERRGNL
jgi:hypothetical protein